MSRKLDIKSYYKRNEIGQPKTRESKLQEVTNRCRRNRDSKFMSNRNISPDVLQPEDIAETKDKFQDKNIQYRQRYEMWKQQQEKIRQLENRNKKAHPIFKPAGICNFKATVVENDTKVKPINNLKTQPAKFSTSGVKENVQLSSTKTYAFKGVKTFQKSKDVPSGRNLIDNKSNLVKENKTKAPTFASKSNNVAKNNFIVRNKLNVQNSASKSKNIDMKNNNKSKFTTDKTKIQNSITKNKNNDAQNNKSISDNKSNVTSIKTENSAQKINLSQSTNINNFPNSASKRRSIQLNKSRSTDDLAQQVNNISIGKNKSTGATPKKIRIINEHNSSLLITPPTRVLRPRRKGSQTTSGSDDDSKSASKLEQPAADPVTPARQEVPEYVSPFVTVSRGKQSMRKEKLRRSAVLSYAEDNSPLHQKIQAEYYRDIVRNETDRLMNIHDVWLKYKNENSAELSSESHDCIDVALGQTKLLTASKFQQFKDLIDAYAGLKKSEGDQEILSGDLNAFWDMIYIQVNNINQRFDRLEKLKNNNWVDILTPKEEVKTKKNKPKPEKKAQVKKGPAKKSQLREHMMASRKKLMAKGTPAKLNQSKGILRTPGVSNKSLNKSVLFRQSDFNETINFDTALPTRTIHAKNTVKPKQSLNLISWDSPRMSRSSKTSTPMRRSTRCNTGPLS